MKPNFALTLSFDGIGLLHRTNAGWHTVGDVALDADDLGGDLASLRATAHRLDPTGLRSKLVIPNDQIKYLSFESDSRDVDILEAQVRNTLDGATPYGLSELAYDWSMRDGEVHVAAVAISTLTEAETFAVDHDFAPMSFVAIPQSGSFDGEPFFGETVHAGQALGRDESVDRDDFAIKIVGQAALPDPIPEPTPEPEPVPDPAPTPDPVVATKPVQATASEPDLTAEPDPILDPVPDLQPDPPAEPQPQLALDLTAEPDLSIAPQPTAAPQPAPAPHQVPDAEPKAAPIAFSSRRSRPAEAPAPEAQTPAPTPQAKADPAKNTPPPAAPTAPDAQTARLSASLKPADPGPTPPVSPPPVPQPPSPVATDPKAAPALSTAPSDGPTTPLRPMAKPAEPPSQHPGRLAFLSRRQPAATEADSPAPRKSRDQGTGAKAAAAGLRISKGLGKSLSGAMASGFAKARQSAASAMDKRRSAKAPSEQQSAAIQTAARAFEDEKQRMTVFGARNPENTATDGPRYMALVLTACLLLFLVAVAAWAAIFLDNGIAGLFRSQERQYAEQPVQPDAAQGGNLTEGQATKPAITDTEALADATLDTLEAEGGAISERLSHDEARARYAATGIWQMAPEPTLAPSATNREDVYQTSLDPTLDIFDAVALPHADALLYGAPPHSQANPPPPGFVVERDSRGFVAATEDGAVTPEGVRVFAGAPPLRPRSFPDRPDTTEAVTTAPEPAAVVDQRRPRARPAGLVDRFERSNNGGRTLSELASIRPRLRPQSAQEAALENALAATINYEVQPNAQPAEQEQAAQQAEQQPDPRAGATQQAVATSLKPRNRPRGFDSIVQQRRQAAAAEPVAANQRVAVSIPSAASVARAATERNQISLRRVNLIGVYGSPDKRRALVRLANGRYRKVRVGDRLDGGKVAAIGESELRYVKSGRSVVLKMPKG